MSKRTERSPVPRDVKRCRRAAQWSLPDPMMEQVMSFCTYAELAPLLGLSRRWHAFARRALVARSQCYLVTRELAGVPPDVRRIIVPLTKADCGMLPPRCRRFSEPCLTTLSRLQACSKTCRRLSTR